MNKTFILINVGYLLLCYVNAFFLLIMISYCHKFNPLYVYVIFYSKLFFFQGSWLVCSRIIEESCYSYRHS